MWMMMMMTMSMMIYGAIFMMIYRVMKRARAVVFFVLDDMMFLDTSPYLLIFPISLL